MRGRAASEGIARIERPAGSRRRVLAVLVLVLALVGVVASAAPRARASTTVTSIPCATDSQGNPVTFNFFHPYSCTITTTTYSDNPKVEDVRIDQPVVDSASFDYPILFHPGDIVTITRADGCAQTGGLGSTWKRYVNPSGDNSGPPSGRYFGSISIPGATWSGGPLEAVPLNNLTAPGASTPAQIFVPDFQSFPDDSSVHLILGYADDDYPDNGYWSHDDGNNDQCANTDTNAPVGNYGGPAFIQLHIVHDQADPFGNTPALNWDIVPNGIDPNGLPNNPEWGWQVNGGTLAAQGRYDKFCFLFSDCTSQVTSYDKPSLSPLSAVQHVLFNICHVRTDLSGHHNWFDVSYTGSVNWVGHDAPTFGDDDYNLRLSTRTFHTNPAGTTYENAPAQNDGEKADIGLEFDSDETIDNFDQSFPWQNFHNAVDTLGVGDALAHGLIDGHVAVVIGLMGADEVHEGHSEIHPVHAIAIEESDPNNIDRAHDRWMFFARNWGDEGECSSNQHYLLRNKITFRIPAPPDVFADTPVSLNSDTHVWQHGTDGKYSFYSGPKGTFVTFDLPPGSSQGYQFGEIDVNWTGAPAARAATRTSFVQHGRALPRAAAVGSQFRAVATRAGRAHAAAEPPDEPESILAEIWNSTSAAQKQTYLDLLNVLSPPQPPIAGQLSQLELLTSPPERPATMPGVAEEPATAKLQRDLNQFQAICSATAGTLPTQSTWCANVNLPPLTVLTTSGGTAGKNGWVVTPVTATLTAYDAAGSGIAATEYDDGQGWTQYTGSFTLPDGSYTLYWRSRDNKGNVETTRQRAFKIDTVPPSISIAAPTSGPYIVGQTITASYGCTDATSGVATCVGPVPTLTSFPAGTLGSHTFTVNAEDVAGNTAAKVVTYNVQYGVKLLYTPPLAANSGSTVPIKLALQAYVNGVLTNVSSSTLKIRALCVVAVGDTSCSNPAIDYTAGTAAYFSYMPKLDQGIGYQFNVQTLKTMRGPYVLLFRVDGEGSATYHADAGATFVLTK